MATISSHVLDSIMGDHARGIRVAGYRLTGETDKEKVFDVIANDQGRISEQVDVNDNDSDVKFELVFHSADYFKSQPATPEARQIMDVIVARITIPEPQAKIHMPVVLSPHSYTVWWSA